MLAHIYLLLSLILLINTIGVVAPRHYGSTFGILGAIPFIIVMMMTPQVLLLGLLLTAVVAATGGLSTLAGQTGLMVHLLSWGLLVRYLIAMHSAYPVLDGRVIGDADPVFPGEAPGIRAHISYWPYLSYRTLAMAAVQVQRSVVYREVEGRRLMLDVYRRRPSAESGGAESGPAAKRPSVIYIHGGAWVLGSRRQSPFLMFELAAAGYVVFAISYRLAPRFPLPAAIEDCKAAVAWVREHAAEYGATPDAVVIGGSAGAHLSAMVALSPQVKRFQPGFESADTRVKGAICLYGFYDFISRLAPPPEAAASTAFWRRLVRWHWFLESIVFAARFADRPDLFKSVQPSSHVSKAAPPMLFIHGANDSLVPIAGSRELHEQLLQAGVPAYMCEVPLAQHAFEIAPSPLHQRTVRIIMRFLDGIFRNA